MSPSKRTAGAANASASSTPSHAAVARALLSADMGEYHAVRGDRDLALACYGSALDEYLAAGLFGMARTIAERMLRRYPEVVRARMTLAVLGLAEGLEMLPPDEIRSTCPGFDEYVTAVKRCSQEPTAVAHLRRLAGVTASRAVRERIAACLLALGDGEGAAAVLGPAGPAGGSPDDAARHNQSAVWMEVLLTPVRSG